MSGEIDEIKIANYLKSNQYNELIQYLSETFIISREEITGEPSPFFVTTSTINAFNSLLTHLANKCLKEYTLVTESLIKAVFRPLRNCVVFNPEAQILATDLYILKNTKTILNNVLHLEAQDCVNMILQFLINLVAKNSDNVLRVWETIEDKLEKLFRRSYLFYYASALLYNILYLQNTLVKNCQSIYRFLFYENLNEYECFLLEIFVQNAHFMNSYGMLEAIQKINLLSTIIDMASDEKSNFLLNFDIVNLLCVEFKEKSKCILNTQIASNVENLQPREVVLLLEIISSLSSQENYQKQLQGDYDLIINCVFLLKSIHTLGKESQNRFTPIQKLAEVTNVALEIEKDPIFGFKASLIRFLGNICWKNHHNQDKLRELDCVPLLLDCCNIDGKNPLIIQWTIFAMRNLCENNSSNQALIATMTKRGVVESSILQEMGLTLHDEGTNKISIVPLPSQR